MTKKTDFSEFVTQGQDFMEGIGDADTDVKIGRPDYEYAFQTHPDDAMWCPVPAMKLYKHRDYAGFWLVQNSLVPRIGRSRFFRMFRMVPVMDRGGARMLWPIKVMQPGEEDSFAKSALIAASEAKSGWVFLENIGQSYAVRPWADAEDMPNLNWPEWSFVEWLEHAFTGRVIDAIDHPVLRALGLDGHAA